jgi:hypothetical protein
MVNQIKWKEEWDIFAQNEMTSSLNVRSEHHVPATVIKDHQQFFGYLKRIIMVRQNKQMEIKNFE